MLDLNGMLPERARPFYEHFYNAAISDHPIADAAQQALSASSSSEEKRAGARDAEQHHVMEGLRAALLRLVLEANVAGQEVMQYRGQQQRSGRPYLERLLAIVLDLCQLSMMEPGTITSLLEELVDLSTVQEMQGVFDFLDRHLGVIKARIIDPDAHRPNNPRMLTMLRTCNKLLRRLSKSNDSQLAGRVLILLAKLCRISDKSGVNMQGFVNEEHSTLVEEVEPGTADSNGAPVDVGFYRTFWQLQAVFQNPQQLLTSTAAWGKALEDIRKTLQRFRALPVAVSTSAAAAAGAAKTAAAAAQAASAEAGADAMEVKGAAAGTAADVTVKYLSSSKLMGLQIQDALFRRHFLVQVLITLHYCQLPPSARLLREGPAALKPKQLQEVQALIGEVEEVLRATPDAGDAFQKAVQQILQRERLWLLWKNSGCRDIERKPAGELLSHPGACKRELELAESKRMIAAPLTADLGDAELSRIWHNGRHSSLQNLTLPNRTELPRLRRFVDRILEDMATDVRVARREAKKAAGGSDKDEADDPMAIFDDDHLQVCGQELFQFRALRQMSRHNCIALVETMEGIDQLEAAAAPMKEQIGSAGLALKCAVWDQFQEPDGWKRPPKKGDKKTKHSSSAAAASADPEKPAQEPGSAADKGAGGGRRKASGEDAEGASSKRRKTAE